MIFKFLTFFTGNNRYAICHRYHMTHWSFWSRIHCVVITKLIPIKCVETAFRCANHKFRVISEQTHTCQFLVIWFGLNKQLPKNCFKKNRLVMGKQGCKNAKMQNYRAPIFIAVK